MNIVKKLFATSNKGEQQSNDNLILIPSGQLFLSRAPSSPKSENECLYNDVIMSIRDTGIPNNYQLIVHKSKNLESSLFVGDDDSDDGDEDDSDLLFEDSSNLKSFLIDERLKFTMFEKYGQQTTIAWKDLDGDLGDKFEFRINGDVVSNDTINQFMLAIYKCEYERKYRKSSSNVTPADLEEFVVDIESIDEDEQLIGTIPASASSSGTRKNDDTETGSDSDEFEDANEGEDVKGELLGLVQCKLFIFDPAKQSFKQQCSSCAASFYDIGAWEYTLKVEKAETGEQLVTTNLIEQMDPSFVYESLSFIFNVFTTTSAFTWLLKFDKETSYNTFQSLFSSALWEHKNRAKWISLKDQDQNFVLDAFNNLSLSDEEMEDVTEDDSYASAEEDTFGESTASVRKGFKISSKVVDDESDEDEDPIKSRYENKENKEYNKGLKIGYKNDRTFISRGNRLGVFRTNEDSDLEFYTAIENISSSKNKNIKVNPDKMMLQKGDSVMILQDAKDLNTLYKMDLEYGKVVEDWSMQKDHTELPVVNFTTNDKFGDRSEEETFLGLSRQSLFRVDPRLADKVVDSEFKQYKTKTNFNQIATTEDGYIAASTGTGEIKLYDKLGKNAKTMLPALGDEFIGLTTSNTGRFILATCKSYLLLIDVQIKRGSNRWKLGYQKSFAKDDKPLPKKLFLRPEHTAYIRNVCGEVSFTKANFNINLNSKNKNPTTIVTSIGPFAITWNLRKALRNEPDSYTIRKYNDNVLMGDFTYNNVNRMILTLPNDVTMVSARSFKKPEKEFSVVKNYK